MERLGVVQWLSWGLALQDFEISWSEVTGGVEGAQSDGVEFSHDTNPLILSHTTWLIFTLANLIQPQSLSALFTDPTPTPPVTSLQIQHPATLHSM